MLSHLYADVVEDDNAKTGGKKKGGSMQTISATHRVSSPSTSKSDVCFRRPGYHDGLF